jgi:DNA-binding transcriptional LysR family regulator
MKSALRNWSDLRVFLAVMRGGSTLAASRDLGMAQPTVARRIDALKHEMGLILFERDTRGFHPTDAAKAIAADAEAMEEAAGRLASTARGLSRPRPIRLTGYQANFNDETYQIIDDYTASNPDIVVEFLPNTRALDLMAGEADMALRLSFMPQHPDLICRTVSHARFTLYGSPAYGERHGLPSCPEEMADHALLGFRRDDIPSVFIDWMLRFAPPEAIVRTFSEVALVVAAIRSGQGLGVENLRMAAKDEAEGRLIRCFDPPEALRAPHMVLIPPQAWRRPEVRAFAEFFIPRYAARFR